MTRNRRGRAAVQQRFQVRQFELFDEIMVLHGGRADLRQFRGRPENGVDRPIERGRNHGPKLLDRAAGRRVELVKRVAGFNPLDELAWQ